MESSRGKLICAIVLAFGLGVPQAPQASEPLETSLRPLLEQAEQIEVTLPERDPDARQAAESLFRLYQSDSFQERLGRERERIAERSFGEEKKEETDDTKRSPEETFSAKGMDRFYLFVSSSMPIATLRNYAADLTRLNNPRFAMVLRGFVGGARRIGPTASFIAEVLKEDPDCDLASTEECVLRKIPFIVDPMLFREFGITHVPAVVFAPVGDQRKSLTVYGDANLAYILKLFARERTETGLSHYIERLGG